MPGCKKTTTPPRFSRDQYDFSQYSHSVETACFVFVRCLFWSGSHPRLRYCERATSDLGFGRGRWRADCYRHDFAASRYGASRTFCKQFDHRRRLSLYNPERPDRRTASCGHRSFRVANSCQCHFRKRNSKKCDVTRKFLGCKTRPVQCRTFDKSNPGNKACGVKSVEVGNQCRGAGV